MMDVQVKGNFSAKKLARLENKKRKMQAYYEIAHLNEQDRILKKYISKQKTDKMSSGSEPCYKKVKVNPPVCAGGNFSGDSTGMEGKKGLSVNTPSGKPKLEGEEYTKLVERLKARKKQLMNIPRLKLSETGNCALLSQAEMDRIPIFMSDLQHLWLYTLLGNHSPYKPQRWCTVQKQNKVPTVCVLLVENMCSRKYMLNEQCFSHLNAVFQSKVEVVTPSVYNGELVDEVAAVPLTSSQKQKLVREYGSLEDALHSSKVFSMLKAMFPVEQRAKYRQEKSSGTLPAGDKFPRTHLLLCPWQLVEENYPVPLKGSLHNKYLNYMLTKDVYAEVTPHSPMFAMDCEMCRTSSGELELTRISVVDEQHEPVYEALVKPHNRIVDYLTRYSGITAAILKDVTKRLEDVQRELRELLPADAILVGQSLNSDLHSLKMMHPYIIDTSIIFNLSGERVRKTKLQVLVQEFLDEKIQQGKAGHCSLEDSISSLKLVQLKLGHSIEFGDAVLAGRSKCFADNYYGFSLLHHAARLDKRVAVLADEQCATKYRKYIQSNEESSKRIECFTISTTKSIIKNLRQKLHEYNMCIAHLKLHYASLEEMNVQATCRQIDKWVRKVWTSLPANGLVSVVFGGEAGNTGASFIQIKTETPEIIST